MGSAAYIGVLQLMIVYSSHRRSFIKYSLIAIEGKVLQHRVSVNKSHQRLEDTCLFLLSGFPHFEECKHSRNARFNLLVVFHGLKKSDVVGKKTNPLANFIIGSKCKMNNEDSSVVLGCLKVVSTWKISQKLDVLPRKVSKAHTTQFIIPQGSCFTFHLQHPQAPHWADLYLAAHQISLILLFSLFLQTPSLANLVWVLVHGLHHH